MVSKPYGRGFLAATCALSLSLLISSCASSSAGGKTSSAASLPAGAKTVSFSQINKNKSEWETQYQKYASDIAPGYACENYSEQLYSDSIDYKGSSIRSGVLTDGAPAAIQANAPALTALLGDHWNASTLDSVLGKSDGSFRLYSEYFKAGINAKVINNKVANLVFNGKYAGEIVDHIGLNTTRDAIIKALGQPDFENTSEEIFGYKQRICTFSSREVRSFPKYRFTRGTLPTTRTHW